MTDAAAQELQRRAAEVLEELRGLRADVKALREQPRRRRRARDAEREVFTISEFAARVGKDRVDVRAAMDDRRLRWIPWGPGKRRLTVEELERVKREGWPELQRETSRTRRLRRTPASGVLPGEDVGEAILALDESTCTAEHPARRD